MVTITKNELRWIINSMNTHIETCGDLLVNPNLNPAHHALLEHQRDSYAGLRDRLEKLHQVGAKQIRIK